VYTRYADDIAFSSSKKDFNREDALELVYSINELLIKEGFNPQHKKLKIVPPGNKKIILGLNVDGEYPTLTKTYKKNIEAHIRGIDKFGVAKHAKHRKFDSIYGMLEHINGLITYAKQIQPAYGAEQKIFFNEVKLRSGL
jgi:RNA-directed DNA polymerase